MATANMANTSGEDQKTTLPSNLLSTLKQDFLRGPKAEKKTPNVKLPPLSVITAQQVTQCGSTRLQAER